LSKHLEELFTDSLARDEHHVAHHPLLMLRKDSLAEVMRFTERTPNASYAIAPLRELFAIDSWWGDAQKLEKFFQLSGELQFWMLAEAKGVPIARVPEAKQKMPDFRLNSGAAWAPSFEVKTLSVAAGFRNIDAMMDGAVDSQIDLDAQQKRGVTFATSEQELTTHGHTDFERVVTTMCRNLIDKTQNNIKGGQYSAATTFLVLNLMLIDSARTGNSMLRPVTPGWPNAWSVNTGVLWTLGFGHVDQFVHSEPEFEGKPAIEGRLVGPLAQSANAQHCIRAQGRDRSSGSQGVAQRGRFDQEGARGCARGKRRVEAQGQRTGAVRAAVRARRPRSAAIATCGRGSGRRRQDSGSAPPAWPAIASAWACRLRISGCWSAHPGRAFMPGSRARHAPEARTSPPSLPCAGSASARWWSGWQP
jgi:hypothetical protein